jgi:hypothetical protein
MAGATVGIVNSGPTTAFRGALVPYSVAVTNHGSQSSPVTWTDQLPAGETFASIHAPRGWSCRTPTAGRSGTVSCSTASLAGDGSATFKVYDRIRTTVACRAAIVNTATIQGSTEPASNSSVTTTAACKTRK